MDDQDTPVWLGADTPSLSDCAFCRYRSDDKATCRAYPTGIPDRWLFTHKRHTTVEPDQEGSFVYQPDS